MQLDGLKHILITNKLGVNDVQKLHCFLEHF